MDDPPVRPAAESSAPTAAPAESDAGELSEAALDAVVGGLSVDAAISRAADFDAARHYRG